MIAPAEKTGRVMLMEDRAGTLVTILQVLLSLSVPPVSIAVSCLSCLRPPPPPLAVHLLFVAPECTDICVVPVLPPPPPLAVHLLFVAPECTDICRTCLQCTDVCRTCL